MTILRSKTAFYAGRRLVGHGDIVQSNDPIVTGREALFEAVVDEDPVQPAAPVAKARKATKAAG